MSRASPLPGAAADRSHRWPRHRQLQELRGYPIPSQPHRISQSDHGGMVPLRIRTALGTLDLLSTTTVFGTPVDITLSELAIESYFPADAATAEALHRMGA